MVAIDTTSKNFLDLVTDLSHEESIPENVRVEFARASRQEEVSEEALCYLVAELACSTFDYDFDKALSLAREIVIGEVVRPRKEFSRMLRNYGIRV